MCAPEARQTPSAAPSARGSMCGVSQTSHVWLPSSRASGAEQIFRRSQRSSHVQQTLSRPRDLRPFGLRRGGLERLGAEHVAAADAPARRAQLARRLPLFPLLAFRLPRRKMMLNATSPLAALAPHGLAV